MLHIMNSFKVGKYLVKTILSESIYPVGSAVDLQTCVGVKTLTTNPLISRPQESSHWYLLIAM